MNCLRVPRIWMPVKGTNLYKWSVVACDQYTSQPEYWAHCEEVVGETPSTLHMILPEVYLGNCEEEKKIDNIHACMEHYIEDGILEPLPNGFMLVERSFGKKHARNGLVVEIDLETYEYRKGSESLIRPTEMTVEERIPPRLKVRQNALVELPHIMLLIDDPECTVIEPLIRRKEEFQQIYETDLMENGGHIAGWLIPEGNETERIMENIQRLAEPERFRKKYQLETDYPLLNMAVGDGNHSMATAKAAWEKLKETLSKEECENHPARFCLCEIVNVHDSSLEIEPIHRVLFGTQMNTFKESAIRYYEKNGCRVEFHKETKTKAGSHSFTVYDGTDYETMEVNLPIWGIAAATIQGFLDAFMAEHTTCKIDYIHGEETVIELAKREGNLGILLPEVKKGDLFTGVIKDGVLPRKTFSMGEANEKRYYMECKKLG